MFMKNYEDLKKATMALKPTITNSLSDQTEDPLCPHVFPEEVLKNPERSLQFEKV